MGWAVARGAKALRRVLDPEAVFSAIVGRAVPHLHQHVFVRHRGTPREHDWMAGNEWAGAPHGDAAELAYRFGDACLQGLDGFSHVEVLFIFDRFPDHGDYREPRPNRGRPDLPPVGVFAGRGPRRPNRIGVTSCAIESVHGRELTVVGLDAVSGTPIIDLKPVMTESYRRASSSRPGSAA